MRGIVRQETDEGFILIHGSPSRRAPRQYPWATPFIVYARPLARNRSHFACFIRYFLLSGPLIIVAMFATSRIVQSLFYRSSYNRNVFESIVSSFVYFPMSYNTFQLYSSYIHYIIFIIIFLELEHIILYLNLIEDIEKHF